MSNVAPVSRTHVGSRSSVFAEDPIASEGERGVSVDQDGKSNVWAIGKLAMIGYPFLSLSSSE
jgi:hypothetical protein